MDEQANQAQAEAQPPAEASVQRGRRGGKRGTEERRRGVDRQGPEADGEDHLFA
ncbi:hypothetical protein FH972_019741 [Carpinus fangiana]|uniref:Uncharacterized protein n=1 Tax=Carpinus fangiana TaxID=176857 RepID=A0A5N6RR70_9ROSI|nr:hypothetical protein FH972_019741 [Carpinus fangiana]